MTVFCDSLCLMSPETTKRSHYVDDVWDIITVIVVDENGYPTNFATHLLYLCSVYKLLSNERSYSLLVPFQYRWPFLIHTNVANSTMLFIVDWALPPQNKYHRNRWKRSKNWIIWCWLVYWTQCYQLGNWCMKTISSFYYIISNRQHCYHLTRQFQTNVTY